MAAPRGRWAGRKLAEARAWLASVTRWPTPCAKGCGTVIAETDAWVVGHIKARGTHPELMWDPANWQVECRPCSDASGQAGVIAKAKAEAIRDAIQPALIDGFPHPAASPKPSPLPFSLPRDQPEPIEVREDLAWNPDYLERFDWLQPLLDIPEDASPPLMMSPVPADAVGTYGWIAIEWIESTQATRLRWWQKLSIARQYEHRADGSLCWRVEIESATRRSGKSYRMRGTALWRLEHAEKVIATPFGDFIPFGEVQSVIHTGNQLKICREVQRGAWRWAEAHWGKDSVSRGNGKEAIETPAGSRWMTFAQDAVYGYDCCYGMVDEAWNVKPDTVHEGLEPAMLERRNPQLVITSTAHRRATSLMRKYLTDAMTGNDPTVLLLLWGAPLGADPGDPAVWKAASAHWSEDRRATIAAKYEKALAGEQDPEFDDPDPMRGFEAQYLNIWRISAKVSPGLPVIGEVAWAGLTGLAPGRVPDAVATEAWFGDGVAVARAWNTEAGVIVAVTDHPDVPAAAGYVAGLGQRRPIAAGASIADHAAWKDAKVRTEKRTGTTRAAVGDLTRYLAEGKFRHTDNPALTGQVLELRTSPGVDGPRVRSTGRMDAVKAAMWAIHDASLRTRRRATVPSRYRKAS
jgi:hypothetical protein